MRDKEKKVKTTKSGDDQHDLLLGSMLQYEEMVRKMPAVKKSSDTTQKSTKVSIVC